MATNPQPTAGRPGDQREDQFWRNPLLHLGACLAVGALVILVLLAIHAIHWVT